MREEHWGAAIDNQVEGILAMAEEHYRRNAEGGKIPEDDATAFATIRANRLTDALRAATELYRSSGYVEVAPFNDERYADHWFEKRLARG